jgi:potassium efflux system protein
VVLLSLFVLGTAQARVPQDDFGERMVGLAVALDAIETDLQRADITDQKISTHREQAEIVRRQALKIRDYAAVETEHYKGLLAALGPEPATGEPAESNRVVAQRLAGKHRITRYEGVGKEANLLLARVDALMKHMTLAEFGVLTRMLKARTRLPLSPNVISGAVGELPNQLGRFAKTINNWWSRVEFDSRRTSSLVWWTVLLVAIVLTAIPTRGWLLKRFGPDSQLPEPGFIRRCAAVVAVTLSNVVLPLSAIIGLHIILVETAAFTPEVTHIVDVWADALGLIIVVTGLSAAALSPSVPHWRINEFTDQSAASLHRAIVICVGVAAMLDAAYIVLEPSSAVEAFGEFPVIDAARNPLSVVLGMMGVLLLVPALLNVLHSRNWRFRIGQGEQARESSPSRPLRVLSRLAQILLISSVVLSLVGYINFGIFITQRIIWTFSLIVLAYLIRAGLEDICKQVASDESELGRFVRTNLGLSSQRATSVMFWLMLLLDIALVVSSIVILLLIWGTHLAHIKGTVEGVIRGIQVGDLTISLVDIGAALLVFILLMGLVRMLQGFLANRVLAHTMTDVGMRDSVTAGIGYAGIVVAVVVALSVLGLEMTQLALIFGALSLGIGFGLQHIVHNFVSGLILLIQRPIKSGDRIVVGSREGYVRKINVVATEIETFDNSTLIVPNSTLVSSEVLNWTHKSKVGRVIVTVGVSYDANPKEVREVLLQCASESPDVMQRPAPQVLFRDFADSSYKFDIRFYVREVDSMLFIASEMRFAINEAFEKAGIRIPFPQRDIHIRQTSELPGKF